MMHALEPFQHMQAWQVPDWLQTTSLRRCATTSGNEQPYYTHCPRGATNRVVFRFVGAADGGSWRGDKQSHAPWCPLRWEWSAEGGLLKRGAAAPAPTAPTAARTAPNKLLLFWPPHHCSITVALNIAPLLRTPSLFSQPLSSLVCFLLIGWERVFISCFSKCR